MRGKYELKDILKDLIGRYDAVGESHIDGPTLDSLKIALPQLYSVVELIFREMTYELGRYEGSIIEIGQEKLEWAKEFKELFDYIVPSETVGDKYEAWIPISDKTPTLTNVYQVTVEGCVGERHVEDRYYSASRGWNGGGRSVLAWREKQDSEPWDDETTVS